MEIANDPTNRIVIEEGKDRRRKLLNLFFKYIQEDITILPTFEYNRLVSEMKKLEVQNKLLNEMRQAEIDRRDVHRPV